MNFTITKQKILLLVVCFILFFRFVNLTVNDLYTDDALYSFRALGWFDHLGDRQTAPVQWFGYIPIWANLSFHDAPPLVFAIQKIFFTFLGPTTLAARLPFAIASIGVLFLFYFLLKKFRSENFAIVATFILTISSYATWAGRIGYLEGIEVLFILLSILFFNWYIKTGDKRLLWSFSGLVAFAILCKYTAIFLIPAFLFYLVIWQRSIFRKSEFWLAVALFFITLSPIIIYNTNVYLARGHFDAALSSMVGMHPEDFSIITGRSLNFNIINSVSTFWETLFNTTSLPLVILIVVSLFYLGFKIIKKKSDSLERIFGLNILMLLLLFLFLGFGPRFFSISMPLLVFSLTITIADIFSYLKSKKDLYLKIFLLVIILIFSWEIIYNFNTNIAIKSIGSSPWLYSSYRFYSYGFNELDSHIQHNIIDKKLHLKRPKSLDDFTTGMSSDNLVFFDDTMSWFAYSWYIKKYQVYYTYPFVSFSDYIKDNYNFSELKSNGFVGAYFIFNVDNSVIDPVKKDWPVRQIAINFSDKLESIGIKPVNILSRQGITAFKVYYVKF